MPQANYSTDRVHGRVPSTWPVFVSGGRWYVELEAMKMKVLQASVLTQPKKTKTDKKSQKISASFRFLFNYYIL